MLIRSLASNYLKRTLRSPFGTWILGGSLLAVLCLWVPVFLYAFFIGFSAVRYLEIDRSVDLLASVNPAILPVLIAWGLFDGLLLGRKIYVPLFPVGYVSNLDHPMQDTSGFTRSNILSGAIGFAVALDDPGLIDILQELATDPDKVAALGIPDGRVKNVQEDARRYLNWRPYMGISDC